MDLASECPGTSWVVAAPQAPSGAGVLRLRRMPWTLLVLAGLFEIGWAIGLKYTEGFTKPMPTALTIVSMIISIGLLGLAMRQLPVGTAYAVWTGIGTVGTVVLGIVILGDSASALRLACVSLIMLGIIGLKLSS